MAEILLDEQSAPAAPAAGQHLIWPDNATSGIYARDDGGIVRGMTPAMNAAVAAQTLGTVDTVVTGSRIIVPSSGLQVGMIYHVRLSLSKTAGGVAAPVWTVRLGTAGTTADTAQLTITGVAQTAIAETGFYELIGTVRTIGAAGLIQGCLACQRTGGTAATGLSSVPIQEQAGTGADKAWVTGQGILLSVNAGGASAWTVTQCVAELK